MSREGIQKVAEQLALDYGIVSKPMFSASYEDRLKKSYLDKLIELLQNDLDFHNQRSNYSSHNFHSFPAKFPPQLPQKFILNLTVPGDTILDPMAGSGTTVLEALLANRKGLGFDIDPLAILISQIKTTVFDKEILVKIRRDIIKNAIEKVKRKKHDLVEALSKQWDAKTSNFVNYWFARETQIELIALVNEIQKIESKEIKLFFLLAFSSIIITKSGGVSLALDLAHTRPHKARVVYSTDGNIVSGGEFINSNDKRLKFLTKTLRSPIEEFEKKCTQNISSLIIDNPAVKKPVIRYGNAQNLPLENNAVDLLITSPPYASNAIDYMRAHKFSLVWFGYLIDDLSLKRKEYIGGEEITTAIFENLPDFSANIVAKVSKIDKKRGKVLHRYYSEMTRTLKEMYRVLKPGKAAILVVGRSIMRGKDTETHRCLAEIGKEIGFEVPKIGVRKLDRNKRMLPAGAKHNANSQIQQRMHEEYVIGFYKPENGST